MAELSTHEAIAHACCGPGQQATCCEPSAKADCCGHDKGCGCDVSSMAALPMAPSCALGQEGLRLQLERYRRAGQDASLIDQTRWRLVIEVDEHADDQLVDELIAIERECCPFIVMAWEPGRRRLTVSVSHAEHESALDAIASAFNLKAPGQQAASD